MPGIDDQTIVMRTDFPFTRLEHLDFVAATVELYGTIGDVLDKRRTNGRETKTKAFRVEAEWAGNGRQMRMTHLTIIVLIDDPTNKQVLSGILLPGGAIKWMKTATGQDMVLWTSVPEPS